ncbi:helix-turn-helix domain-containing protein [Desulfolucanica intricata]|uniref:helix-turn-helix domain-containing protein n=1 Tax=Desulfolucanica intricata TaxID=1285191 RepID=UPI0008321410|nr:helix-turn-helix domain-containing protein [Desulfolucanica intricata]
MEIGYVLKKVRERRGMRQADLGPVINYSRETVSAVEAGRRRLPEDAQPVLSRFSPLIALAIAAVHSGETLPLIYLNNIDRHPVVMTAKAVEESLKYLEAVKKLNLINKNTKEELTEEVRELFEKAREECWDDVICKLNWLVETAEVYGFDMHAEYRRIVKKLEARGYIEKETLREEQAAYLIN